MAFADAQTGGFIAWGEPVGYVTLSGTVSTGDILGYSSGWVRALATVGTAIQGRLIAGADGVSGDKIPVFKLAVVSGRHSGATAGNPIYVAEGTDNGKVTETAPSTTNDCNTIIGRALTATELLLFPDVKADSLAA